MAQTTEEKTKEKSILVIFDFDGVIVDSEPFMNRSFFRELRRVGCRILPKEVQEKFMGLDKHGVAKIVLADYGVRLKDSFFEELFLKEKENLLQEPTLIPPLMSYALAVLKREGIPCCIASNNLRPKLELALQVSGLASFFKKEDIFTADQVAQGKPSPDIFLFAATQMGHNASSCIIVEDSPAGIQAAKAAGIPVIAFLAKEGASQTDYIQQIIAEQVPLAYTQEELLQMLVAHISKCTAKNLQVPSI